MVERGCLAGPAVRAWAVAVAAAKIGLAARCDGAIGGIRAALAAGVAAVAEDDAAGVSVDPAACAVRRVAVQLRRLRLLGGLRLGAVARLAVADPAEGWARPAYAAHAAAVSPGAAAFAVVVVGTAQPVRGVPYAVAVAFVAYANGAVGAVG